MTTDKVEGADNSATEAPAAAETPETSLDLHGLREQAGKDSQEKGPEPAALTEEKDEWLQPPSSLKPEYKAEWAKLPKNWRGEFYRRETDFHKGIEPYKASHAQWERLSKEVLSPHMARIQASGLPVDEYVKEFMLLDHVLATGTAQQKAQAVNALAQHYKLDLSQFGKQEQQLSADPTVRAMQQELAELRNAHSQSQTAEQRRAQAFEQERQQEAERILADFRADPKNVYFDDVKDDMAALLSTGRAKDVADAYDKACRLNPTVHAALAKQQREQEEKQRIEEARRKTANARAASFDVQAQGAALPGSKQLTLNEELRQRLGAA